MPPTAVVVQHPEAAEVSPAVASPERFGQSRPPLAEQIAHLVPEHLGRSRQTLVSREDIKEWRLLRSLTLAPTAKRAGCSTSLLCRVENGSRPLELWLALKLIRVLVRGQ